MKTFALLLMCLPMFASAQSDFGRSTSWFTDIQSIDDRNQFETPKPSFSVGLGSHHYEYEESIMHERSAHRGLTLHLALPSATSALKIQGDCEMFSGGGTYYGATWGGTPVTANTTNRFQTLKALVGGRQVLNDENQLTYSVGLGYRTLTNKDEGAGSYTRVITYNFMPFVLEWTAKPADRWTFSLAGEYDYFRGGRAKSSFSDVSPEQPDVVNEQNVGSGYRLTMNFTRSFGEVALTVQPYFQRWNIADSSLTPFLDQYVVEPANSTTIQGVNILTTF